MIASFPGRRFQLWLYKVSHGSLLVRSPKGPDVGTNVDLMFAGVEFVELPRHLRGVEFDHGSSDDVRRAEDAIGHAVDPGRVFVLRTDGRRHVVVAAGFEVREHEDDLFSDPFE